MKNRPHVTISFAQSIDGRIATATGESRYISGAATLELSQELRRDNDAILVGVGTVLRDNPLLTCRLPGARNPLRVVLDSRLTTPRGSQIVKTAAEVPTLVFFAQPRSSAGGFPAAVAERRAALEAVGVEVVEVTAVDGRVDLPAVVAALSTRGIRSLYVEGGAAVITSFLKARMVDHMLVVTAPLFLGRGVDAIGDLGVRDLSEAWRPREARVEARGSDAVWVLEW